MESSKLNSKLDTPQVPKNLEELANYPSYKERKYIQAHNQAIAEGKQPPARPEEKGKKTKRGKPAGVQKKKKETLEEKRARRAKKKWTKEKAETLLECIRAKVPFEEIATKVGKKKRYVIRRFKVQVLTLKRAGKTVEEIEKHFDMTENEIMDIIGKHPLPKPRPVDNKKRILENKEILSRVEAKVDDLANAFNRFLGLFSAVDNFCEENAQGHFPEARAILPEFSFMLASGEEKGKIEELRVNIAEADSDIEMEEMRKAGEKLRFDSIDGLYDHCLKYGNFKTELKKVAKDNFEEVMMGSQSESDSDEE